MSNRSQLAVILAFAAGAMAGHSFEDVVDSYNNDNQQALETEVTEPVEDIVTYKSATVKGQLAEQAALDLQENEQKAMDKKKGRALRDTLCSEVEEAVHAMQELSLQAKFTFSYDNDGNCNLAKPGSDPIDISHSGGYSSSAYIAHGSFPTSWGWATAGDRFSDAASAKVLITKKIYDRLNAEDRVKLSNVTGNNEPSTEGLFNNTAPLTEREMSFDISRDKERNRYYALGLYAIGDRPRP